MSSAREQILKTLRGTTMPSGPRLKPPALPAVMTSASDAATPLTQRVQSFAAVLDKLGAPVELVADMAEAGQRVAAILMQHEATSLALSDAPEALAIAATLPSSIERCHHDAERDALMRSHAGLSGVQWAIAETGTLALVSRHERHRLATLLPDLHIALVPASRLLATLGDAFARLEAAGVPDAATITFVTGPSRTADIELELVVGVHGPKALHVLVIADA
jgi:L-lactate dehydrogenase complex protein LldG